jgi:hypothetical protein
MIEINAELFGLNIEGDLRLVEIQIREFDHLLSMVSV